MFYGHRLDAPLHVSNFTAPFQVTPHFQDGNNLGWSSVKDVEFPAGLQHLNLVGFCDRRFCWRVLSTIGVAAKAAYILLQAG